MCKIMDTVTSLWQKPDSLPIVDQHEIDWYEEGLRTWPCET